MHCIIESPYLNRIAGCDCIHLTMGGSVYLVILSLVPCASIWIPCLSYHPLMKLVCRFKANFPRVSTVIAPQGHMIQVSNNVLVWEVVLQLSATELFCSQGAL